MLIGISEHDGRLGRMCLIHTGGPGRPQKVFLPHAPYLNAYVGAHLHIMLLANPYATILKAIKEYLNKNLARLGLGARGNMHYTEVYNMKGLLEYIFRQSTSIRTLEVNERGVLHRCNDMGLFAALEELNADPECVHTIQFYSLNARGSSAEDTTAETEPEAIEPPPPQAVETQPLKLTEEEPCPAIIFTFSKTLKIRKRLWPYALRHRSFRRIYSQSNVYAPTDRASILLALHPAALHHLKVPP